VSTEYIESDRPAYHVYYPAKLGLRTTIRRVLKSCHFTLPFEDMQRDVRRITRALSEGFRERPRKAHLNFQIHVINAIFFRNKAAYVVGKGSTSMTFSPLPYRSSTTARAHFMSIHYSSARMR
jgi:isocitrate dehydrogenase kinase/phosphatase